MFFLFPALPMLPFLLIHIVAAVLPAFLLLRYIYRHDTVEKEPPRLLGLLLLMQSTFLAILEERNFFQSLIIT
ncbi:MAG: hypothetical protein IIT35_00995 [Oscillospiraceae bacterium]|nr:hypothetical protein [Oscillospiraceae bacterium]